MTIIADSGSTKADWKIIDGEDERLITTPGLNPVFHTAEDMVEVLRAAFDQSQDVSRVEQVFYYGSGCWDSNLKQVVQTALQRVFINAELEVHHDLLGAARAASGHKPGIACILGTGSNSCLYDGHDVVDNVTNLGYLLGDEGSGTHLGKKLIRAYFYRELPKELATALNTRFPGGKQAILDNIYGPDTPNVYLASFTRFMHQHRHHSFIQRLLNASFSEFIDRHVRKYPGHLELPIHFIGSVAYYFQEALKLVLEERGMGTGNFVKKPIDNLSTFHLLAKI